MDRKKLDDLTINGFGRSNGGHFEKVTLNGKGTIDGDVTCVYFECNGSGIVNGDMKSKKAKISGNVRIDGKMNTSDLIIEGRGTIHEDTFLKNVKIAGKGSFGGHLSGEEVMLQGRMTVDGDCEVETFKAEGQFTIDGLLSADCITVDAHGESRAKEIGGQTINVKNKRLKKLFKTMLLGKLETDLIEGDFIDVEYTNATVVRGNEVKLGPYCEVDLVEYSGSFAHHETAKVKESRKV
ncbi:cytoplasmic protein [Rossellomorea sp. BNER]|uniref:cytoplasmic protein n=1 Tax=Rossellomorea sp. BNER TaxID=2962031 RepID=UPI003AF27A09|nr:polymer-forming cytoskeletal protein [Rossellomorea sp. BNER]